LIEHQAHVAAIARVHCGAVVWIRDRYIQPTTNAKIRRETLTNGPEVPYWVRADLSSFDGLRVQRVWACRKRTGLRSVLQMPDACCWTASIRTCLRCRQKRCRPKSEIAWDHMRIHPNSLRSPSVSRLLPYYAARWLFDTLNLVATAFLAWGATLLLWPGRRLATAVIKKDAQDTASTVVWWRHWWIIVIYFWARRSHPLRCGSVRPR
jgi:hypothetical protein